MNEPKPLPSETKLVETPSFVKLIANMEEEFRKHDDWVERACVMLKQAAERIRTQDAALASLADELRLAQTELKGCYRLIDELKEELRLAREEQIALLRFVEHPVTPEMWKALFPKEPR